MISTMFGLSKAGKIDLIRQVNWVKNDYANGTTKIYIKHEWQGTVIRTDGYHYDTEITGQDYNSNLLPFIPADAKNIMEIGCNNGSLARAYKNINYICNYTGLDINSDMVDLARKPCDFVFEMDIESADEHFFQDAKHVDCWIFAEVLEYLNDPLALLEKIRKVIPTNGSIVACIPNMQHWSMQARLNSGDLKYETTGLLKPHHLRWFSRNTIVEMFQQAGFQIIGGIATIAIETGEQFHSAIRLMAQCTGIDPEIAVQDATPLHYIIKAIPVER